MSQNKTTAIALNWPTLINKTVLAAWLAFVLATVILHFEVGHALHASVAWFASTPEWVARGQIWKLFTSSLVLPQLFWPQLVLLLLVTAFFYINYNAVVIWLIALICHIGGTLFDYTFRSLILNTLSVHFRPLGLDYGTSLIWGGLIGALGMHCVINRKQLDALHKILLTASLTTFGIFVYYGIATQEFEHMAAFFLGAGSLYIIQHLLRSKK